MIAWFILLDSLFSRDTTQLTDKTFRKTYIELTADTIYFQAKKGIQLLSSLQTSSYFFFIGISFTTKPFLFSLNINLDFNIVSKPTRIKLCVHQGKIGDNVDNLYRKKKGYSYSLRGPRYTLFHSLVVLLNVSV